MACFGPRMYGAGKACVAGVDHSYAINGFAVKPAWASRDPTVQGQYATRNWATLQLHSREWRTLDSFKALSVDAGERVGPHFCMTGKATCCHAARHQRTFFWRQLLPFVAVGAVQAQRGHDPTLKMCRIVTWTLSS